ncbi:MAG: flagellar hook-associated protein FlgL [Pseudomonadota bacterium]|nr:flagellar hook-associated protein FlgL [Pseudomonadota bacterium]
MITRMSTPGQHAAAIAQILKQQTALSRTQVQVASGRRIQSPADDPVGATRIMSNERAQAQLTQYGRNADMALQRLGSGELALADLGSLLQRIHVVTVQANNGAMDDASLRAISTEVRARAAELLQIANRQDSNGEYLYAGFSTTTRPFAHDGLSATYGGDQGARQLQISATQKIADSFNGERVFMNIPAGNGQFVASAGVHAGTGVLGSNQVSDPLAWAAAAAAAAAVPQPHTYTIQFADADADGTADNWEVVDAGGTQVATGSYAGNAVISFNGAQVSVSGQPAAGDTFTIAPAGTEDMFRTLDDLVAALEGGADTPQSRAQLSTRLNKAMAQLARSMDHVDNLRAETGARISALDSAGAQREDLQYQLDESLSALRDLDYAEAISRLNQQAAGLQAAQTAYTRIGQMSLFDVL